MLPQCLTYEFTKLWSNTKKQRKKQIQAIYKSIEKYPIISSGLLGGHLRCMNSPFRQISLPTKFITLNLRFRALATFLTLMWSIIVDMFTAPTIHLFLAQLATTPTSKCTATTLPYIWRVTLYTDTYLVTLYNLMAIIPLWGLKLAIHLSFSHIMHDFTVSNWYFHLEIVHLEFHDVHSISNLFIHHTRM